MTARTFAADVQVRLHIRHALDGAPAFLVVLARPPIEAVPESLVRPGEVSTLLTHSAGIVWPDRSGEDLARVTLDENGVVVMGFASLADALACQRRIGKGDA